MAITKIGTPLDGIRGTVGGITFSENHTGTYAKKWSRPVNPKSAGQVLSRNQLSLIPEQWRGLTQAQRDAWDTWAALAAQEQTNPLGDAYYLSGWQWFVKLSKVLLRVGRALPTTAPAAGYPALPTISAFRVTPAGTDVDVATGGTASASTERVAFPASYAFDNILSAAQSWRAGVGFTTGWLQYVLTSSKVIRRYDISNYTATTRSPKDWTFERLDAGPTWTPIDTQVNKPIAINTTDTFYCANETASTTYRLNVSANNGDASVLSVTELDLFTGEVDGSVIIYPDAEYTSPATYDLVLHVAVAASVGRASEPANFLELLAKQSPGATFEKIQSELEALFAAIEPESKYFARNWRQSTEGLRSPVATDDSAVY